MGKSHLSTQESQRSQPSQQSGFTHHEDRIYPHFSVPKKNRSRRKIAAFSNRKVRNHKFSRRNRKNGQEIAEQIAENLQRFLGVRDQNRSVPSFQNRSVFGTLRPPSFGQGRPNSRPWSQTMVWASFKGVFSLK